jgi:hypothetical protein
LGTERPLLVGAAIDEQADWLNQESPKFNFGECQIGNRAWAFGKTPAQEGFPIAEIFYVLKSTYYLSTMWSYSLAFLASSL